MSSRPRKSSPTTTSRKTATGRRANTSSANRISSALSLVCPECGKPFTRPASLGAHRNRAHGVVGASATLGIGSRRRASAGSRARSGSAVARRAAGVNRDGLLEALFPNGVPPREEVIRDVNAWLDEAERLSRQR